MACIKFGITARNRFFWYLDTCSSQGLPSTNRRESSAILSIYIGIDTLKNYAVYTW